MDYSSFVLNVVNGYKLSLLKSPVIAKKELDFTIIRIKTKNTHSVLPKGAQ